METQALFCVHSDEHSAKLINKLFGIMNLTSGLPLDSVSIEEGGTSGVLVLPSCLSCNRSNGMALCLRPISGNRVQQVTEDASVSLLLLLLSLEKK